MALPVIDQSHFTGYVNITQNKFTQVDFSDFISIGEVDHLRHLLGDQAYIYIRDNNHPAYTALFAGTDWVDDDESKVADSLTEVLKLLIYADWVYQSHVVNTSVGPAINMNENAQPANGMVGGSLGVQRLARAAKYWESICPFIEEYRSVTKEITSVDNTDPLNPVCTVDDAIYLQDGDTVTILGVEYTAANATATTFDVSVATSGMGSTFVGENAVWEPFGDVQDSLPEIKVGFA